MEPASATQLSSAAPPRDNGPVPMSFPAILRNTGIKDRFAHLRAGSDGLPKVSQPIIPKRNRRDEKEGKRWVRRKENACFVDNPHIVAPTKRDYSVVPPSNKATFPEPLPAYLSRNSAVPAANPTLREPNSANAGRFSLSLKGMRKELRKSGPRTEQLVREVEDEIICWLRKGGVLLNPDVAHELILPGTQVGSTDAIKEVSRTPLQLVWSISDDAFARYVVHCCARYHNIVSFSKDTSGQRLTYILRPNVTRPDFFAPVGIDTPPATESDFSGMEYASESDFASDRDPRSDAGVDSDLEGVPPPSGLSNIAESVPGSPALRTHSQELDESWLVIGEAGNGYTSEQDLASSVGSLSLRDTGLPPHMVLHIRQVPYQPHLWERQRRSASSPSRSPARRMPPRAYPRADKSTPRSSPVSFYEYLFA